MNRKVFYFVNMVSIVAGNDTVNAIIKNRDRGIRASVSVYIRIVNGDWSGITVGKVENVDMDVDRRET